MIYFCTENYIKTNGVITSNVDVTQFSPLVQFCSKAYVKPLIGTVFFNDLLTKYNNQTLSIDETTLVGYIQPAILWRVCAQAGTTLSYQLTNKGYIKQSDDNGVAADLDEVSFMYSHYISEAILFEDELKKYLDLNKDLFPVFLSDDNKDSKIKTNFHNYKGKDFNQGIGFFFL